MQGLDVSELLVEGKQIWIWRVLASWAGDSEMVCEEDKGDIQKNDGTCTKQVIAYQKITTLLHYSDIIIMEINASCLDYLWLLRGSGVRDTLRMGLPPCEGECCLRWFDGDVPEVSKRP